MMRLLFFLLPLLLVACEPPPPIRLGYVGAVSGRFSDLDSMGRDGALLAVELRNRSGGVQGRQVELLVRDAGTTAQQTVAAVHELAGLGVAAIVGPMTSIVAVPAAPAANAARLPMVAGTATTTSLSGHDDYFFRIIADAGVAAGNAAQVHRRLFNWQRVAIVIDMANGDYAESWLNAYRMAFLRENGAVAGVLRFDSRQPRNYQALADAVLALQPDLVAITTDATDAALLAQRLRQKKPQIGLAGSNWVGTERLLEVGGKAVDGMVVEQSFLRDDAGEAFQQFHRNFIARFGREPNVGGIAGFDAANVVMDALRIDAAPQHLKATLLAQRRFKGVQDEISFDGNGDALRRMYLCQIRDGRFIPLP